MTIPWIGGHVEIVTECLGYRSALALAVLAIVYALVLRVPHSRILGLVGIAVALAVGGNIVRIGSILLFALAHADFALGLWHDLSGYVVFAGEVYVLAGATEKRRKDDGHV